MSLLHELIAAQLVGGGGGGGGYSLEDIASGAEPSGDLTLEISNFRPSAFAQCKNIRKVTLLSADPISGGNVFAGSSATEIVALNTSRIAASNILNGCMALQKLVIPKATYYENNMCNQCTALEVADIGGGSIVRGGVFTGCKTLKTLIIRSNAVCSLGSVSNFSNAPFANGGSGGTIYIPKVLYDHLGDGTELDYKAATNWATLDSYGTITWAQIEGSIYENAYADGTPIT